MNLYEIQVAAERHEYDYISINWYLRMAKAPDKKSAMEQVRLEEQKKAPRNVLISAGAAKCLGKAV